MKTGKAEPIGELQCPREGCTQRVKIFRYQERSARPSMFKGKFHGRCADHGAVIQASDPSSQELVLNTEGAIWGATAIPKSEPAPAPAARSTPIPASKPAELAIVPTPKPTTSTAVVPSPAPAPETRRGWNLWDWWAELMG
jgi:hypothetical protein